MAITLVSNNDNGDEGCPGNCGRKMRARINALEEILPLAHRLGGVQFYEREELAAEIEDMTGIPTNVTDIANTLGHIRYFEDWHGFTVPHAPRGPANGQPRYFKVYPDAKVWRGIIPSRRRQIIWTGFHTTLMVFLIQTGNALRAIEIFEKQYLGNPKHAKLRTKLQTLVTDGERMSQQIEDVINQVEALR
jgi:hypothetical protein